MLGFEVKQNLQLKSSFTLWRVDESLFQPFASSSVTSMSLHVTLRRHLGYHRKMFPLGGVKYKDCHQSGSFMFTIGPATTTLAMWRDVCFGK